MCVYDVIIRGNARDLTAAVFKELRIKISQHHSNTVISAAHISSSCWYFFFFFLNVPFNKRAPDSGGIIKLGLN